MQNTNSIEFAGWRCRYGKRGSNLPTAKQVTVLAGLASGMTQKEIARKRGISPSTVKSTAEAMYCRLRAVRATDAVSKAIRRGWIAPLVLVLLISDMHHQAYRVRQPNRSRETTTFVRIARKFEGVIV
uniref:response regulator transcription factor n=1 Tax=Halomonas sp. TaxID=1486246 RepID=UPI0026209C86|nr:LuxR C-terminal-related transcriptional regulator [Halomonas sp.]